MNILLLYWALQTKLRTKKDFLGKLAEKEVYVCGSLNEQMLKLRGSPSQANETATKVLCKGEQRNTKETACTHHFGGGKTMPLQGVEWNGKMENSLCKLN